MTRTRLTAFAAVALLASAPGAAQNALEKPGTAAEDRSIPRLPDGRPDFNGVWFGRGHADLSDGWHLEYEVTIDDPKFYAKPWKNTMIFTRRPGWELIEYSCDENNKDRDNHHFQPGPSFQRPR